VYGEDGTIQRLLERYGVPHTGSKAFSSALGMNKVLTKNFLRDTEVKLPQHVHITKDSINEIPRIAENIADCFGPQYIIKPVSSGASAGTMMVKNPLLLNQAITDALSAHDEIIVEAKIPGREATCGVIERYRGKDTYTLPPVEIVVPQGADFYSEEIKANGSAEEFCPSRFTLEIKNELEELAKIVHHTLGLSQYSRSDFIVSDDGIYFLEVNSQPQLTPSSLFSKSIEAVGGSYADFITHLLTDALSRHPHK
jgi:D-alanine-D-alanine ligase